MMSFIAGAAIAAVAAAGPAPALEPGDGLSAIQDRAEHAIDLRQDALDRASAAIDRNEYLTDAHRAELEANIAQAEAGLDELGAEIAGTTVAREAKEDFQRIFTDYRVFAVVIPQSAYVSGTDRLTETAIPRLEEAYDRLEPLAADDADAAASLHQMRAAIDEAAALTDGLADRLLAVDAEDYNDDNLVLTQLRRELADATAQVRAAAAAGRDVAAALR